MAESFELLIYFKSSKLIYNNDSLIAFVLQICFTKTWTLVYWLEMNVNVGFEMWKERCAGRFALAYSMSSPTRRQND